MTIIHKTIDTAPKDGSIIYIFNAEKCIGYPMFWNSDKSYWQGMFFAPMRSIKVFWDPTDICQPTHWRTMV